MTIPRCVFCEKLRVRPLFFIIEGEQWYAVCHDHVAEIWGEHVPIMRGGWEVQLSGDTWLVKVRR